MSHKEAVHYIRKSRKKGYSDEQIRVKMLVSGYMPKQLNDYFKQAEETQSSIRNFTYISVIVLVLICFVLIVGKNTDITYTDLTGAVPWSWPWSRTYNCGDDYPAEQRYVKDLSDCVGDEEATKQVLFCYLNNTLDVEKLSPNGVNDDWYWENLGINLSLYTIIDSITAFGNGLVLPYNNSGVHDNVDCFSWTHGTSRTENWHHCNETEDSEPPNLVFYYEDTGNLTIGGISTELYYNSSYYLCYDELNCTTQTTACDESADYYCIGRLESKTSSTWFPCDTTHDAPYYRCCKGGCEGLEMMCGEYVLSTDGVTENPFNECSSDRTSGCCDSTTDCVYNNTCYNEDDTIMYHYLQLGVVESGETIIEPIDEYYTFTCTDAHWCPWGFEYNELYSRCEPVQAACYDATDTDYCNYIHGVDDIDLWEADTTGGYPCTRLDPEGVVYKEACIYSGTYGGVDYFFYQDITRVE